MAKITQEVRDFLEREHLGFFATVCPDGTPNLSPKGLTFVLDDDHLVIGEVRSPQTRKNLESNPCAEINVVDIIARKGYRFKGTCEIVSSGAQFDKLAAFVRERGARSTIQSVIVMTVERVLPLVSPAYELGRTEQDIRKEWKARMDDLNADLNINN